MLRASVERKPGRTLVLVALVAATAVPAALAGLKGLSARQDEFYSRGTPSYEAATTLARAGKGYLPNLLVIFPVGGGKGRPVLAAVQAVATLSPRVSYSKHKGYAAVAGRIRPGLPAGPTAERLAATLSGRPGVLVGGSALSRQEYVKTTSRDLLRGEALALPLLLLLTCIAFRSVVAAMLPLLAACLSAGLGVAALRLVNTLHPVSALAIDLLGGLSVGLSLDYSLLLVSRFREELARGASSGEATEITLRSAGRTVAISALVVIAAFASALVFPVDFLRSLVIGGMLATTSAALVAVTATPAALALLGERVSSLAPSRWQRSSRAADSLPSTGFWYRLAKAISVHPVAIALVSTLAVLALGAPALWMRTTGLNGIALPASSSATRLERRLRSDFEAPLLEDIVVLARGDERQISRLVEGSISRLPDVESGEANQLAKGLWAIELGVAGSPFSAAAERAVRRLRSMGDGLRVTGATADYLDTTKSLRRHLPPALALLALAMLAILALATRSVILPVKALLLSAVSLAATMGALVLAFQTSGGQPFAVVLPILVGVGAFGLLTDYGVFMLMRILEERSSGRANSEAVAVGLQRTGATVTTAAMLFCVAVGGLLTARLGFVREAAFGLVAAVAIDAAIVRSLLVPSLMTILGEWNWWPSRRAAAGVARDSRRTNAGMSPSEN
jgi:RND superfamily putative drug exporter